MNTTTIEIRPDNRFVGKTGAIPRPTAATMPGADAARLAREQEAWDLADAWAKENEKLRLVRLARLDAERDAQREARQQAADDRFVGDLREKYMSADPTATDADFQRDLQEIKRQHRIKAALSGGADDGRARADNASRYVGIM